jgi:hypothetical protein
MVDIYVVQHPVGWFVTRVIDGNDAGAVRIGGPFATQDAAAAWIEEHEPLTLLCAR